MSNLQRLNIIEEEEEEDTNEHEPFWTPHFYDPSSPAAITYIPQASTMPIPYDLFVQDTHDKIYNQRRRPPHAADIGHMIVHMYSAPGFITQPDEIPEDVVDSIIGHLIQNRETIDEGDRDNAIQILDGEVELAAAVINELKVRQREELQNPVRRV
jgi:hypothetical protein